MEEARDIVFADRMIYVVCGSLEVCGFGRAVVTPGQITIDFEWSGEKTVGDQKWSPTAQHSHIFASKDSRSLACVVEDFAVRMEVAIDGGRKQAVEIRIFPLHYHNNFMPLRGECVLRRAFATSR